MILTPAIMGPAHRARPGRRVAQVVCFSGWTSRLEPRRGLLVVIALRLLGGSLTGAVAGFAIGLLHRLPAGETMGAISLALLGSRLRRRAATARPSAVPRGQRSCCSAAP